MSSSVGITTVFCPDGVFLLYSAKAFANCSSVLNTLLIVSMEMRHSEFAVFTKGSFIVSDTVALGSVDDIGGKGSFGRVVGVSSSSVKSSSRLTSLSVRL